ncbi:MAG TPA: hypothetical protein VIZ28_07830 [Chitinophagaceae bacterium]
MFRCKGNQTIGLSKQVLVRQFKTGLIIALFFGLFKIGPVIEFNNIQNTGWRGKDCPFLKKLKMSEILGQIENRPNIAVDALL